MLYQQIIQYDVHSLRCELTWTDPTVERRSTDPRQHLLSTVRTVQAQEARWTRTNSH